MLFVSLMLAPMRLSQSSDDTREQINLIARFLDILIAKYCFKKQDIKQEANYDYYFHELIKKNTSQMRFGTLYYKQVSPNKKGDIEALISMLYDTPKGEYYIINKTNLYNGIDGHKLNFSYRFVPLMKLLGNAVAWAMNGDIYSICSNLQTDYTLTSDANHHIVALSVKKGKNKGITRMLMKYSKKTGLIEYLEIEEKLGITHKYSMGLDNKGTFHQPQINTTINASVFTLN